MAFGRTMATPKTDPMLALLVETQADDEDERRNARTNRRMVFTDDATQTQTNNTQDVLDPRRLGRNNSGLSEKDHSDVICILHPATAQALRVVEDTAQRKQQFILQYHDDDEDSLDPLNASEAETVIRGSESQGAKDIALRFSSRVNDPSMGFCFGRNRNKCDINLDPESTNKRISNVHFRIYYAQSGVLMIDDLSTNGTLVDSITLGGRKHPGLNPTSRMIQHGAIIEVLSTEPDEVIKFIVRVPPRHNHEEEWKQRMVEHMRHVAIAQQRADAAKLGPQMPEVAYRRVLAAPMAGPPNSTAMPVPIVHAHNRMMKWDGDGRYNFAGFLGKGAFAVVYQVASVSTGDLFAAKELEKKRFVKNGVLDTRLDNEMQIMKDLSHPNIVQYIEYKETDDNLYIIMEFVPGGDLAGYTAAHGALQEEMAKDMSQQILSALAYLHARSITHRDIKPDNILISSDIPFVTKLTDFGLSKVVKNNETFLKTFCGTLLYCAPEVFPHYDNQAQGQKRRRSAGVKRSYSQLVDIWSYAAVLWYCLCMKPPFEGIMDHTGRAMFDRIMSTPLDTTPLQDQGISAACIDLLDTMLDIDPSTRPSEADCLNHRWLNPDGQDSIRKSRNELEVIDEDDEDRELDASNLHITDENGDGGSSFGDIDRSHLAKRQKANEELDASNGRVLLRQEATLESEGDSAFEYGSIVPLVHDDRQYSRQPQKLFGEISHADLQGFGHEDLGSQSYPSVIPNSSSPVDVDLNMPLPPSSGESIAPHAVDRPRTGSSRSLGGTEAMVRDLHMTSPGNSHRTSQSAKELITPVTPQGSHDGSFESAKASPSAKDPEQTPKAKFDRRIKMPVAASMWWDPYDSSTHNIEHSIKQSGIDFNNPEEVVKYDASNLPADVEASLTKLRQSYQATREAKLQRSFEARSAKQSLVDTSAGNSALASTDYGSLPSNGDLFLIEDDKAENGAVAAGAAEFAKPLPRLGRLNTTRNSFLDLTIPLSSLKTTWGRHPSSTVVYRDSQDTRIPKVAFDIRFQIDDDVARDSAAADHRTDEEILNSPDLDKLQAYIHPLSKSGLRVNGVPISQRDAEGNLLYGQLFSGDEVWVSWNADGGRLVFTADIFHGMSKEKRKKPGFVVEKIVGASRESSASAA